MLSERLNVLHALPPTFNAACCSVGSHVRDAAAYVCWAFARAYSSEAMEASLTALAPALLVTACYDREVRLLPAHYVNFINIIIIIIITLQSLEVLLSLAAAVGHQQCSPVAMW